MTGSAHEYTATLLADGDEHPLGIRRAGRIVFDEASAPHVTADLEFSLPDEALQLLLEPRDNVRVRIDVDATFPTTTQARSFDLGLRARPIRHGRGAFASVRLASDEALLSTFRQGADDSTPRTHEASLRAVVNYTLGTVIPGAALEADPDNDADVTAYWPLTNLIINPSAEVNTTGWGPGTGTSAITRITGAVPATPSGAATFRWTASGTGAAFFSGSTSYRVTAGQSYVFSGYLLGSSPLRNLRPMVRYWDAAGAILRDVYGPAFAASTAAWQRFEHVTVAPAGATGASVHVQSVTNTAGQFHYADAFMFHEGTEAVPYFDGSTVDDAHYAYDWDGDTPHAAASIRTPILERRPEALTWRAEDSALEFLHPLVQAAGYRLVCDEQRRWTLRAGDYTAPGALTVREGVNLIEGEDVIDIDRGDWFDAQVTIYRDPARILPDVIDYFELNSPPTVVNKVIVNAPYPGPGRSEYAVRRAQGRGREVTVTLVADWRTHAEQPASFTLDAAPIQTGRTSRVEFDLSNDRMTVSSRTTDTPASAWVLIPVGEKWNDSPVGESWNEEVI